MSQKRHAVPVQKAEQEACLRSAALSGSNAANAALRCHVLVM
jgi:hypothetical protein